MDVAKEREHFACLCFKAPFDSFIGRVLQQVTLKDFALKINRAQNPIYLLLKFSSFQEINVEPLLTACLEL